MCITAAGDGDERQSQEQRQAMSDAGYKPGELKAWRAAQAAGDGGEYPLTIDPWLDKWDPSSAIEPYYWWWSHHPDLRRSGKYIHEDDVWAMVNHGLSTVLDP